jgi:uncharacterized protein involved in exopolysaccharide biosynthesis
MQSNSSAKDELSIKELVLHSRGLWNYIVQKRKTIAMALLLGAVLGLAYSFLKKPTYRATLSFALEDKSSGGIGGAISIDSPFGIDLGGGSTGGAFSSSNLPELFLSRNMVERTLLTPVVVAKKEISLAEMYIQNEGWRKKWENKPELKSIAFLPDSARAGFTRVHDSILGVIYENLSENDLTVLQKDKKIAIIYINLKSSNEVFAKQFTEALAKQVSGFYIDYKSKKARQNVAILVKQTDSVRAELNSAITGVAVSIDRTFNLNPALNVRKSPTARKQVDVQANTFILTELIKQGELAKVALRKETPLIQVIDRPILPLQKEKTGAFLGAFIGGFLGAIIAFFYLIFMKVFKNIMQ